MNIDFPAILTAAVAFVETRRKPAGGFGATPRLPATIEDTYHALRTLDLARHYGVVTDGAQVDPAGNDTLLRYLAERRRTPIGRPRTIFQLLWCCRAAGLPLDQEEVAESVFARMRLAPSLDDWYYSTKILMEVLGKTFLPEMPGKQDLAGLADRGWRGVDEAWMLVFLSRRTRELSLPRPATELITWFRASQNGDGGFGFFPSTTSFIENCYFCVRALAELGTGPTNPDGAVRFLVACQTGHGGFGRGLRAVAFLDATWQALATIALLDSMEGDRQPVTKSKEDEHV